jgi:hypothetical protein
LKLEIVWSLPTTKDDSALAAVLSPGLCAGGSERGGGSCGLITASGSNALRALRSSGCVVVVEEEEEEVLPVVLELLAGMGSDSACSMGGRSGMVPRMPGCVLSSGCETMAGRKGSWLCTAPSLLLSPGTECERPSSPGSLLLEESNDVSVRLNKQWTQQ